MSAPPEEKKIPEKRELFLDLFEKITQKELNTKDNELYSKINSATIKIASYFEKSVTLFPSLFENNSESFKDFLSYLEKIAIPNECVCAGIIDNIAGWTCKECSTFKNTIYCFDCIKNSFDLHKGHHLCFLPDTNGMCDCGDPLSVSTYCKIHSGPFTEQKQIDDYIQKSFGNKIVEKIKNFFDEFFFEFSKYFILNEKCELFFGDIYDEKFKKNPNDALKNEKEDVDLLKSNFCVVFQNFIYFLRLITKNNSGMVQIIANYFSKNNFGTIKLEDEYLTEHRCIEINKGDINILYDNKQKEKHICKCPFLSIFTSNYRNEVKLNTKEDEEQFIYSFAQNLQLRTIFSIIYHFQFKNILYNHNDNLIYCRTQFYLEDSLELIATKTSFLEDSIDELYNYSLKKIKENTDENINQNKVVFGRIKDFIFEFVADIKYYTKPKMRLVMTKKTLFFKKAINLLSLFHNIDKYKSIYPHPEFQNKLFNLEIINLEIFLLMIPRFLNLCLDWKNMEKLKDIYQYLIHKILNQEKEGIRQLSDDEFTINIVLYRAFGIFINDFCFNHSLINNCTVLDSIKFFKKTFFESQEQIENFVDIVQKDYFKFFGFVFGTRNNFFNYYEQCVMLFQIFILFFAKYDYNTIKYIFALSEKKLDINSYLKISNIENIYTKFDKIFNSGFIEEEMPAQQEPEKDKPENVNENSNNELTDEQRAQLIERIKNNDKSIDETNMIRQWESLIEMLILIAKEDSSCYWCLIEDYADVLSLKVKNDLFNTIKKNKNVMEDLNNILKEKIITNIISYGNLMDSKFLERKINKSLFTLFDENNIYNQTLDELTNSKMNEEKKIIYLKDQCLKYIDCNYYINPKEKTEAQKYILDFKKDIVKIYNYYFYNNSELTFDFILNAYEKIFLNKDNLELIIKIFEKLLNEDRITVYLEKKSIRSSLLPTLLNYLQMLNVINTKSFIEFKLENKNSINKLHELLCNFIKNNDKTNNIDKDLEDNMKAVINQMNQYQLILDYYENDLSKLNKYDFNTTILSQLKQNKKSNINSINIIPEEENKNDKKEKIIKGKKEKLKLLMKKKSNNFMKKIESNEEILKAIDENIDDVKKMNNNDDEIMCFYCRNSINLKSFEKPYGKLGIFNRDLFYINSIKATLRDELQNLGIKDEDNKLYSELRFKIKSEKYLRINSCGHYFHNSCYIEGFVKDKGFNCPICLKNQNTLIPPLTLFHDKNDILKPEKLSYLIKREEKEIKDENKENGDGDKSIFDNIVSSFLLSIELFKNDIGKYSSFLENIFPNYKALFNYLENIFYSEGTTFHKQQQIDNMKNLILSLRVIISTSKDCQKEDIAEYIKETLLKLAKGPEEEIYLYQYEDSYMHYLNLFEKIVLSLIILFDYDEIKELFNHIIYIFLPYICFGIYYEELIIEKKKNEINQEQMKQKLDLNEFKKYLNKNNNKIMIYFTSFMKRFCFIKIISDYNNKNEDIMNNINALSIKNIFSILDMNDLVKTLPENDININDIINNLFKTMNEKDIVYQLFSPILNFDKVLNSIMENAKKYNSDEKCEITPELIIQFHPIKFNFIHLDDNIFDLLIKYLEKKCIMCNQVKRMTLVCLICGERVCFPFINNNYEALDHAELCSADFCCFFDINELNLYCANVDRMVRTVSLYINKNDSGLKKGEITNEFKLSHEKLKLALKNYVAKEFKFK